LVSDGGIGIQERGIYAASAREVAARAAYLDGPGKIGQ